MSEYKLKIIGTTPLLQNNPASMLFQPKGKTRAQSNPTPEEQVLLGVYQNEDGQYVHPTSAFRSAFITAAKKYKIGRGSAATSLAGAMSLDPADAVILCDPNGEPLSEYEPDTRIVVNPSTKGRVVRGRPKFREWGCLLTLVLNDKFWAGDDDLLQEIFEYAGQMVGVGDGRPEKRALQFGKFNVETTKL